MSICGESSISFATRIFVHPRNARVRRLDERERSTRRASGEHHHHRHRLHQHPRRHHHPHHHPCHHPHPHPRQHHHQQRHLLLHRRRQHPPLDRLDAGVESPGRAERDLASSRCRFAPDEPPATLGEDGEERPGPGAAACSARPSYSRRPSSSSREGQSPGRRADGDLASSSLLRNACNMNMQRRHASRRGRACLSPQWERLRSTPPGSLPDGASRSCAASPCFFREWQPARRLGRELRWPPSRRSSRGPAGRSRGHCHVSARPRHRPDRRHRRSSRRGVRPGHVCARSPTRRSSGSSASRTGSQLS
mmetsp:Transcript_47799/g.151520  ORF Transcript_47799/g.151520 Transcript_47799/m.151520 type:complete len:307 (+) Transcript_47799:217-1137(+)